ncbi:hypothetical protein [Aliiroseovarius crassostreae]
MKMTDHFSSSLRPSALFGRFQKKRRVGNMPQTIRQWSPKSGFVAVPLGA